MSGHPGYQGGSGWGVGTRALCPSVPRSTLYPGKCGYTEKRVLLQETGIGVERGGEHLFLQLQGHHLIESSLWFLPREPPPLQTVFSSETASGQGSMGTEATQRGTSRQHTTLCPLQPPSPVTGPRAPASSLLVHVPGSHLRRPLGHKWSVSVGGLGAPPPLTGAHGHLTASRSWKPASKTAGTASTCWWPARTSWRACW